MKLMYVTVKNEEEAKEISTTLVEEKLVACVNMFPIKSIYRWQGKVEHSDEFGMIMKTKDELVEDVIKKVKELHSYEVPCVISFDVGKGNPSFIQWVNDLTK